MENQTQGEYKIWWDDKEKIVRFVISGALNIEITEAMVKDGKQLIEEKGRNLNWMVNMENLSTPVYSPSSRKMMTEAVKILSGGKIAMIGVPLIAKVAAKFILVSAGYKNVKFFSNEEEALKWLKEE